MNGMVEKFKTERRTHEKIGDGKYAAFVVVLAGSLWGICEATIGHLLHLLSRFVPGGSLAGFFMFPIGAAIMLRAVMSTGRTSAAFFTAATAAAVKMTSAASPAVTLIFTANPSLAILAEGLAVFAGLLLVGEKRAFGSVPGAVALSLAYRLAFLAFVAVLPVQKGILLKSPDTIMRFLLVESAVNGILIPALLPVLRAGTGAMIRNGTAGTAENVIAARTPGRTAFGRASAAGLSLCAAVGLGILLA